MKKFLFFSVVAIAMTNCTSDVDESVVDSKESVKLVDAVIPVSLCEETSTRSYLGQANYDAEDGNTYVQHFFESSDLFLVCDYWGQYVFKCVGGLGQSTAIQGRWAEVSDDIVKNGITVIIPAGSAKDHAVTVADDCPTMHLSLPTTQETRYKDIGAGKGEITYQRDAGLSFACSHKKSGNLSFFPIVTYLYFTSSHPNCVVAGTSIAGDEYNVTYTGKASTGTNEDGTTYTTVDGISPYLQYSANAGSIVCKGYSLDEHENTYGDLSGTYEFVVCIRPGAYEANDLRVYSNTTTVPTDANVKAFHNKKDVSLYAGFLYYFGSIDPVQEQSGDDQPSGN